LADLSAITGQTGEGLKAIEGYARESAKTFGLDAAQAVESYKLVLSQLTPEIAKTPSALKAMGDNIAVLSKTMGGDATAAAEVLTTAMNQFGVDLSEPTKASQTMAEMMNVMSAAAKEGSAELPAIKLAIQQVGMAAKGAGVSFVDANAAIQVLDKAGKKGAEGGVALRNVMSILAQGRFLPKDVKEELQGAGIDVEKLGDKSMKLSDRLAMLKPVMKDSALFGKLFGRENSNAAMALVQATDKIDAYSEAITGTNTAFEQADVIMESYAEKQKKIQASIDDAKISLFNVAGGVGIWASAIGGALVPMAQLAPLFAGLFSTLKFVTSAQKMLGVWTSIVTGATKLWTGAQIALNFAMSMNPIAWVVIGIGALVGAIALCWNKFAGFRAFILTMWDTMKGFGNIIKEYVVDRITGLIDGVGAVGSALAKLFKGDFKGAFSDAKTAASGILGVDARGNALNSARDVVGGISENFALNLAQERGKDAQEKGAIKESDAVVADAGVFGNASFMPTGDFSAIAGGGAASLGKEVGAANAGRIKNVNVTIDKVVDKFTINTTNLREDLSRVKDLVGQALTSAVNDFNYVVE
ncbi:MAG: phage tail tape measure protein, partial [Bacteroidales bacterium]